MMFYYSHDTCEDDSFTTFRISDDQGRAFRFGIEHEPGDEDHVAFDLIRDLIDQANGVKRVDRCEGCFDDFYNGKNPHGVKECWNLKSAKVVKRKKVGIDDRPPWNDQPVVEVFNCYKPKGFVMVDPERIR